MDPELKFDQESSEVDSRPESMPSSQAETGADVTPGPDESSLWRLDEDDRYARLRLIGWWDQNRLATARILVVGAGALGNEVLKNLALLGIGQIHIVDFDQVQPSNLSRSVLFRSADAGRGKADVAATAVRDLNPDCRVRAFEGDVLTDIGIGWVREADVVVGCVDNREARLWINRMCWKVGTPWVDGGIQEINGVAKVFVPGQGPCYECGMTDKDYQLIQLRYSCPLLKQEDILQGRVPTSPTIASIIGGLQVQEVLKLLHELPVEAGSAHVFNGAANRFYTTRFPDREDCLSHESYDEVLESPLAARTATVSALADWLAPQLDSGEAIVSVELDRDFLIALECRRCERRTEINRPRSAVAMNQAICETCGEVMLTESIHELGPETDGDRVLATCGVPDYDIVKVHTDQRTYWVQLQKEADRVDPIGRDNNDSER